MTTNTKITHYVEDEDLYILPKGRMNFVALARKFKNKKSTRENDEGQFVVSCIIPPEFDLTKVKKAVQTLGKEKFKDKKGKPIDLLDDANLKGHKSPFLKADDKLESVTTNDGDEVDLDGWTMIRANTYTRRPVVRNSKGEVIDVDDLEVEAYSGRWCRLLVKPKDYDQEGNKGVKFYLEGVQLLAHDDKIGGGSGSTGEAFGAVDDEDDGEDALA